MCSEKIKRGICTIAACMLISGGVMGALPVKSLAATADGTYETGTEISGAAQGVSSEASIVAEVDVEAADDDSEIMVSELEESNGAVLYGGIGDNLSGPEEEKQVSLSYSKIIRHEEWFTRSFTVSYGGVERVAYCIEPKDYPPDKGNHTAITYDNELMKKALYYSYGYPGFEEQLRPYLAEAGLDSAYSGKDGAYVVSHLLLSYFYDNESENSDAFKGLSDKTKTTIKDLAQKLKTQWPDVPNDASLKLDRTFLEAEWDPDKQHQETPVVTLVGDKSNKINVRIPEGSTMVKLSGDELTEYMYDAEALQMVEVYGGDEFFFTAPESVKGTYESGNMAGSLETFQPYVIQVAEKQDIMYCGDGAKASVSFVIEWENVGSFVFKKVSATPDVTEGNDKYSLENARYEIYGENGAVYGTIKTDDDGNCEILLPYGNYMLKETEAPAGYLVDEHVYEFAVNGEVTPFVHEEQPSPVQADIDHSPQTGDDSRFIHLFAAAFLSMTVIVICVCRKAL